MVHYFSVVDFFDPVVAPAFEFNPKDFDRDLQHFIFIIMLMFGQSQSEYDEGRGRVGLQKSLPLQIYLGNINFEIFRKKKHKFVVIWVPKN